LKTALVLGSGYTLADDVAQAGSYDGVVACNDAGWWWPGELDAWVTFHPEDYPKRIAKRRELGHPDAKRHIAWWSPPEPALPYERLEWEFPGGSGNGSSSLFAAKVALVDMGFDRIKLCGVPLSVSDHFYGEGTAFTCANEWRLAWAKLDAQWLCRMVSYSGWTKALLEGQAMMTRLTNMTNMPITLVTGHVFEPGKPVIVGPEVTEYPDNRIDLQSYVNGAQLKCEDDYAIPAPKVKKSDER
jgi:hypothetical protein